MRVLTVFGTRPEAIKMGPVIKALSNDAFFESKVCVTGQHREMLDQVVSLLGIQVDYNLDIMSESQTLSQITTRVLNGVGDVIDAFNPDVLLVHGDTTTTFSASLAAFYRKVPVAHVEAGLRTYDLMAPWPEEANRRLTDAIARMHFVPTRMGMDNLLKEGGSEETVFITGNTVVDALMSMIERIESDETLRSGIEQEMLFVNGDEKIILVTGHRRESYGKGFEMICESLAQVSDKYPDVRIVYPVHLNPNVREPVFKMLKGRENVYLIEPLDYPSFVYLMMKSYLILTDSGGIQEEAPTLNKPVLIMRDKTERREAVDLGIARLTGANTEAIVSAVSELLDNKSAYTQMTGKSNPYGDGMASCRIVDHLKKFSYSCPK